MTMNSGPKQIKGLVKNIHIDFGTEGLRMTYSIEGGEDCREIGNYPGAQAGMLSLVSQAPTNIIYKSNNDEPAKPVAFGYIKPCCRQKLVFGIKIALLPDPENYSYAYTALVDAMDDLYLKSIQQIPEDFLRFAIEYTIKECGCLGNIYIHGESDYVAYTNLPIIEDIISDTKESVFKKRQNYIVAIGIFDLGAGTTDITTSKICFQYDGGPPVINELRAPLGFAIGGASFDERFIDLLRIKLGINMTPDKKQAFFKPFMDHFHTQSKLYWTTNFEDEEYPFRIPDGKDPFVLIKEDMTYIMELSIDETCRCIGEHLVQIIRPLDFIIISGGNSEVPDMVTNLNAVVHGLHYWINHPQLIRGRYACMILARMVKHYCKEFVERVKVPAENVKLFKFYDYAERIMIEGILVPDGIQTVDIYFDIDINAKNLNLLLIDIYIPNKEAETYTSGNCLWNFASECRTIGALHLESIITNIEVGAFRKVATKSLRRPTETIQNARLKEEKCLKPNA
ncbi:hypothetical protein EAF04_005824 [Stromatinia cepivora]|nr:hypothetical protein EAF04_005824 [Stromatinia cepivora]